MLTRMSVCEKNRIVKKPELRETRIERNTVSGKVFETDVEVGRVILL